MIEPTLKGIEADLKQREDEARDRHLADMRASTEKLIDTLAAISQLRELAKQFPDLRFDKGLLCSATLNPQIIEFRVHSGCGCCTSQIDDLVTIFPYSKLGDIAVHSDPPRISIGTVGCDMINLEEGWKTKLTSLGFGEDLISNVDQYFTDNRSDVELDLSTFVSAAPREIPK